MAGECRHDREVQTGAWKSRLHSGNTEQDMRNALVKSFMCDHYSKTMHWAATDRDPARYGIRGRSEYWLHRPSPTFQHRERAFFLLVAEKERKSNGIRPSHHLPRRRRATRRRNGWRGKGNQEPAHQGHQRLRSKRPSSRQTRRWNDQPTYIGVWGQDRLIGAALIQPALCVAETLIYRTGTSGVHAAQIRELSPSMQPSSKGSRSSGSIGAKASDRRSSVLRLLGGRPRR